MELAETVRDKEVWSQLCHQSAIRSQVSMSFSPLGLDLTICDGVGVGKILGEK